MTPERFQQIESVLQDALDRPPLERASFLESVCAGDHELKAEAYSLINAYLEAGDFIEQPAITRDAPLFIAADGEGNIGRAIGPYKIIESLGAGGMGEVYLAQDTRLSRLVALKLLPSYFASDDARLRRFQSEARAASALNHPNILTIYEVGESEADYFIATEFIEGQTLRQLIRERELSVEEILRIVRQIGSALAAAHAAGIVHRDIKPENIMLRPDGLLKILDFGIAKLMECESVERQSDRTQTETGLLVGTVNYMSPEQARGLPIDERTDIWSLGVVLYEMLTRRLPFKGDTRMDTIVAILDREPTPLSQVTNAPWLQTIINKCLSKDVAQRYRTVSELLDDLKHVKESTLTSTRSISHVYIAAITVVVMFLAAAALIYRRQADTAVASAPIVSPTKLYSQMSERERLDFVSEQEHRISGMISNRAEKLNDDAVRVLKAYVDRHAGKLSQPTGYGSETMSSVYDRAQPYVPLIARSFAARKVPIVIGIYLPVIESAYRECYVSELGATGLFQFLPRTAGNYGVARRDMCNAEKMAPAAAHFFADLMAELGEDSDSVTLVLLSYNRGANSVRDTLRQLRATDSYERNVWTMITNNRTLDEIFRDPNAGYVPTFFAAAIIGENPEAFGLTTPPLSTLAGQ